MNPIKKLCVHRELKNKISSQRERLFRIVYSWCHDPVLSDDLTQETMVKALKSIASLKKPESLDCWLYGILMNCWRDHFRKQRDVTDIENCEFTLDDTPETQYQRQHISNTILSAVACLPVNQRQTLTLVDLEGFSYAEVAGILDTPIGTVMSRLCRARKSLATKLLDLKTHSADEQAPYLRRVK